VLFFCIPDALKLTYKHLQNQKKKIPEVIPRTTLKTDGNGVMEEREGRGVEWREGKAMDTTTSTSLGGN